MIDFLMRIFQIIRILSILAKKQILTHPGQLNIPANYRFLGKFLGLVFYPIGLFNTPKLSFGNRLTSFFEKLGPIYIKFGQTLSTRPDLVGAEVAKNLRYLQDSLPAFSSEMVHKIIDQSFGEPVEKLFESFDDQAVAAASISQVHKARLKTGELVAIKILRPGIHKKYNKDIKLLYFLARIAAKILPKMKRLRPIEVVDVFKETMKCELDLRLEAAAASQMADNFRSDFEVYIPQIYWNFTSEDIMTTEWIEGISIYDTQALISTELDPSEISRKIAVMFFNQAYRDGFFHADLHPGNILVMSDGTIALLDFGIMGRLAEKDRLGIAEILFAFLKRDYKLVAKVHHKVGYIPHNTNLELFAQSCRAVCEPIVGIPLKEISIGKLLAQLFKVTEDFGMETQPQLLLLQKTMVVVEGIGQSLDHEINMWQLAEPWIKKWAVKNISPEAKFLRIIKKIINELLEKEEGL